MGGFYEKNSYIHGIISADYSPVTIMVIPTDEERGMAEDCYKLLFE